MKVFKHDAQQITRRSFIKGMLTTSAVFAAGCARDDIFDHFATSIIPGDISHKSNTDDGEITIYSGSVLINKLYENDIVPGVITQRGIDRGLFHKTMDNPTDTYDPQNGRYIRSTTFTIQSGATLSSDPWGDGLDNRKGIIWISCSGAFINQGTINMNGKGGNGGLGGLGCWNGDPYGALGIGLGASNNSIGDPAWRNTASIITYGSAALPTNNWSALYGSGGGGGNGGTYGGGQGPNCTMRSGDGRKGGAGGGAIRIYANSFDSENGNITANGLSGEVGCSGAGSYWGMGGSGGGGSGGTIYIECNGITKVGTNRLTASGGPTSDYSCDGGGRGGGGGAGAAHRNNGSDGSNENNGRGGTGGAGSYGRIHIVGTYTGSTNPAVE